MKTPATDREPVTTPNAAPSPAPAARLRVRTHLRAGLQQMMAQNMHC